jgi:two-component system phosphate regulon sensor histidine kinase PhoR
MSDMLVRMLLTIAVYWGAALALGMLSGPAWGFTLGSAGLLFLLATQMRRLDPAPDVALPLAATPTGLAPFGGNPLLSVGLPQNQGPALPEASASSCGVGVLDREFRLFWCNDTLARHFGIADAKAMIGESVSRLTGNSSLSEYFEAGVFGEPLRLELKADGTVLALRVTRYVGTQWLLLSLDVTYTDKLEARRRDCMENALHELRAPMMVLSWSLDVMRERTPGEMAFRDRLSSMTEQCRRMRQITEDLRNLSALEAAPDPSNTERVGMDTLLRVVQAEAEALAGNRQRVILSAESGFDLLGSRVELASAFSNLVGNAVRYTPAGGEIRLTWRASSAAAEFVVEDTGIGIAREHIPRLTERFYQADRSFSRKVGGAGLGLAIVKDVLDRHQATLTISSEPGKGSRFAATFPAHRIVPVEGQRPAAPQGGILSDEAGSDMPPAAGVKLMPSFRKIPLVRPRRPDAHAMPAS